MILLFNFEITNFKMFKNCISSLSGYPWKKAIFCYENKTKEDIGSFLEGQFSHTELVIGKINRNQKDWNEISKEISADLIWICCKYDYVFVDKNFDHLNNVIEYAKGYGVDKLFSISISNWRESLKQCTMHDLGMWDSVNNDHSAPTFYWLSNSDFDSHRIINKGLFEEWYCTGNDKDFQIVSPEDLRGANRYTRPWKVFVSPRELCRNSNHLCEENNFIDETVDRETRKRRLTRYYLSAIPKNQKCLANPLHEPGIFKRVMKYYGFHITKRKK